MGVGRRAWGLVDKDQLQFLSPSLPQEREGTGLHPQLRPHVGTAASQERNQGLHQVTGGPHSLTGQAPWGTQNQGSESLCHQLPNVLNFLGFYRTSQSPMQGHSRKPTNRCWPLPRDGELQKRTVSIKSPECRHAYCWAYICERSRFYNSSLLFSRQVTSTAFTTPRMVAHQAPLSMGFPGQEYWSGLPFPPPGDLPDPGINLASPAWQADSLPLSHHTSIRWSTMDWK